jgi:putative FmdB family regulatory protein
MPIYEYACEKCQTQTEIMKPVSRMANEEPCEVCKTPMQKLISKSSFRLIGSNWSRDGYSRAHIEFKMKDGSKEVVPYKGSNFLGKKGEE